MRICNDSTASCLSEDFIQPYDRNYIGIHKITKHIARQDLATAEAKRGVLLSVLLPVLLTLTSFLGGAYLVMDTTAGERERQSLEPLLVTPASRPAIVSGKIAAACVIGLVTLLLTLLAFRISAQVAGGGIGQMLKLNLAAMLQMLLVMLPMLFIGTTLLTLLSASAKSLKEAQSHMTWLMLITTENPLLRIWLWENQHYIIR